MTQDRIEYLHDNGLMPDRYYYQFSNKPIYQKYNEYKNNFHKEYLGDYKLVIDEQSKKEIYKQIEDLIGEIFQTYK